MLFVEATQTSDADHFRLNALEFENRQLKRQLILLRQPLLHDAQPLGDSDHNFSWPSEPVSSVWDAAQWLIDAIGRIVAALILIICFICVLHWVRGLPWSSHYPTEWVSTAAVLPTSLWLPDALKSSSESFLALLLPTAVLMLSSAVFWGAREVLTISCYSSVAFGLLASLNTWSLTNCPMPMELSALVSIWIAHASHCLQHAAFNGVVQARLTSVAVICFRLLLCLLATVVCMGSIYTSAGFAANGPCALWELHVDVQDTSWPARAYIPTASWRRSRLCSSPSQQPVGPTPPDILLNSILVICICMLFALLCRAWLLALSRTTPARLTGGKRIASMCTTISTCGLAAGSRRCFLFYRTCVWSPAGKFILHWLLAAVCISVTLPCAGLCDRLGQPPQELPTLPVVGSLLICPQIWIMAVSVAFLVVRARDSD